MTGSRRPSTGVASTVVAVLVAVALGAITNIFTGTLPESWTWSRNWQLMGTLFVGLAILAVLTAVAQYRQGDSGASTSTLRVVVSLLRFGYGRAYRRWVRDDRRTVETKGLITIGPSSPELEAVFVDVALTSRAPGQVSPGLLATNLEPTRRRSVWQFLNRPSRSVLAVLSAPGSGKTTLLSHVARRTADAHRDRRRSVPVLLQLREHSEAIVADPKVSLPTLIRTTVSELVGTESAGWWERQLRAGRCVVLLDGLDEVADADTRRAVVQWINTQLAVHPRDDFVIASRPLGYRDSFVSTTDTVQVLPFTRQQVKSFLHKWYRAAERQEALPAERAAADSRGAAAADHLLRQIDAFPGLHDLTVNPLLLTMIANVHRYRQRLPENRAALYSEVCTVMVGQRDLEKGIPARSPAPEQRLSLLGRLAFQWMQLGIRDLDRRALLDTLRPWLAETAPQITAADFLTEIEGTGLLVAPAAHRFSFTHHTFQEYLAARYIAENLRHETLAEAVDDPWWRETTLLYAAENDPNPVVTSALRVGTVNALSLAFEVAESGAPVDPELGDRLNSVLRTGLQPGATATDRRIAVDVLVGRLLRSMTFTPDGSRISRRPITVELYRLFRSDTATPPPDGHDEASPTTAARGMWRGDAETFLTWINKLVAAGPRGTSGTTFRLPSVAELTILKPAQPVWVTDRPPGGTGTSTTRVWYPAEVSADVTAEDLAQAVAGDLPGSTLYASMLASLAVRHSDTVISAAGAANAKSTELLNAAHEFARASIVAKRSTERPNVRPSREIALARSLRSTAESMQHAAASLAVTLQHLPDRDARYGAQLTRKLDRCDTKLARDNIDRVSRVSMARENLLLTQTAAALAEASRQLGEVRSLLRRVGRPTTRQSPIDYTLVPVSNLKIYLPIAYSLADDPADAIASSLLPKSYMDGRVSISIELDGLAAKLSAMSRAEVGRQLAASGFDELLNRLVQIAEPIVSRRTPITAARAAAIRAPALLVARMAGRAGDQRLALHLIELAAAMYLLERRQRDGIHLESLILVDG